MLVAGWREAKPCWGPRSLELVGDEGMTFHKCLSLVSHRLLSDKKQLNAADMAFGFVSMWAHGLSA